MLNQENIFTTNPVTTPQDNWDVETKALFKALPLTVIKAYKQLKTTKEDLLLEIILDLGRNPTARFEEGEVPLGNTLVTQEDINYVVEKIGHFGDDNRAGIEATLHRISGIRNRDGKIVGLTCRVGRSVTGTIEIIHDLVQSGKSLLLLGPPGVGKTTMLRECARVLSESGRRVVVVDTSNEIGGDGDIPHPGIGKARRMQVPKVSRQHEVMIEAVENHMPEVIVIDEIGNEKEAQAARTIAERGVQLIATAHGKSLSNLLINPTLNDLLGGVQAVTLGDLEAQRRGTQKTVLERKAPPTFDILIEILERNKVAVHMPLDLVVDSKLRGNAKPAQIRERADNGLVVSKLESGVDMQEAAEDFRSYSSDWKETASRRVRGEGNTPKKSAKKVVMPQVSIFPYGVSKVHLEKAAKDIGLLVRVQHNIHNADYVLSLKNYAKRKNSPVHEAEVSGIPIYLLKGNTANQLRSVLQEICHHKGYSTTSLDDDYEDYDSSMPRIVV